ncbi:putative F-box/kelch-repeat protein [Raphanus sativus]|nr:putative F-box/kelch-repeat protein [Raphanus sativus]
MVGPGANAPSAHPQSRHCLIENVWYYCGEEYCSWFDTKLQKGRVVKSLEVLNRNCCAGALAVVNYYGKLLILWDKPGQGENKNIWCAVIALERCNGDEDFMETLSGLVPFPVHTFSCAVNRYGVEHALVLAIDNAFLA